MSIHQAGTFFSRARLRLAALRRDVEVAKQRKAIGTATVDRHNSSPLRFSLPKRHGGQWGPYLLLHTGTSKVLRLQLGFCRYAIPYNLVKVGLELKRN